MSLRELTIDELLLVSGGDDGGGGGGAYSSADFSTVMSDAGTGIGGYVGGELGGLPGAGAGAVLGGIAGRGLASGIVGLAGPGVTDDVAAIAAGMQNAADGSGGAYSGNTTSDVGDPNNGPGTDSATA